MVPGKLTAGVIAAIVLLAPAAHAQSARSLADCERLSNWHAYNTCLASFGPRRGQRVVTGQPPAEGAEGRVYRRSPAVRRGPPGMAVQRVQGGRVRATFDIAAPRGRR